MEILTKSFPFFYCDYNATSPFSPRVLEHLRGGDLPWANPSSVHYQAKSLRQRMKLWEEDILSLFGMGTGYALLLHSGATEGINQWAKAQWESALLHQRTFCFLYSSYDHKVSLLLAKWVQEKGGLAIDLDGHHMSRERLMEKLEESRKRFSKPLHLFHQATWVNGELGVKPLLSRDDSFPHFLATLIHDGDTLITHVDAAQTVGKIHGWHRPSRIFSHPNTIITYSSHKFGGLKGMGFSLYPRLMEEEMKRLTPLFHGGHQQRGLRAGTENALGLQTTLFALQDMRDLLGTDTAITQNVQYINTIEETMRKKWGEDLFILNDHKLFGTRGQHQSSQTIGTLFRHSKADQVLVRCDLQKIYVGMGAACSSDLPKPNDLLIHLGYTEKESKNFLRWSFSPHLSEEWVLAFCEALGRV